MIEEIDVEPRWLRWVNAAAGCYGGLDILALDLVRNRVTGEEFILEVVARSAPPCCSCHAPSAVMCQYNTLVLYAAPQPTCGNDNRRCVQVNDTAIGLVLSNEDADHLAMRDLVLVRAKLHCAHLADLARGCAVTRHYVGPHERSVAASGTASGGRAPTHPTTLGCSPFDTSLRCAWDRSLEVCDIRGRRAGFAAAASQQVGGLIRGLGFFNFRSVTYCTGGSKRSCRCFLNFLRLC